MGATQLRLVWVTNHQAPYREPLWRALTERCQLNVCFLHAAEAKRQWHYEAARSYTNELLRVRRLRFGGVLKGDGDPVTLGRWRSLARLVLGSDVVILGGWDDLTYLQIFVLAGLCRKPLVLFAESTTASHRHDNGPVAWLRQVVFKRADAVWTPGPDAAQAARASGAAESRIVVSGNSIDIERFRDRVPALRSGPPSPGSPHRLIYIGQLIERKNVGALLRAIKASGVNAELAIVGSGESQNELAELSNQLGLAKRVKFLGHLEGEALDARLARAQTLVLPSTQEVWGFTVLEALAAGLGVIVSDAAGVAASVTKVPGVLVVEPSVDSLADAIARAAASWQHYRVSPVNIRLDPVEVADDIFTAALQAIDSRASKIKKGTF